MSNINITPHRFCFSGHMLWVAGLSDTVRYVLLLRRRQIPEIICLWYYEIILQISVVVLTLFME